MPVRAFLCALVIALGAPLTTAAAEPPIDVPVILPLTGGNAFAGSGQRAADGAGALAGASEPRRRDTRPLMISFNRLRFGGV